jgi:hypothetical protein
VDRFIEGTFKADSTIQNFDKFLSEQMNVPVVSDKSRKPQTAMVWMEVIYQFENFDGKKLAFTHSTPISELLKEMEFCIINVKEVVKVL